MESLFRERVGLVGGSGGVGGVEVFCSAIEFVVVPLSRLDVEVGRRKRPLSEASLAGLVASIRANGVLQPPLVFERADGMLEILAGVRRFCAAGLAGLTELRVGIVRDGLGVASPARRAFLALTEQLQRASLNEGEEVLAILGYLMEFGGFDSYEATARFLGRMSRGRVIVADRVKAVVIKRALVELGVSLSSFAKRSSAFLRLPDDVRVALRLGELTSLRVAQVVASVTDDAKRDEVLKAVCLEGLGFAEIEDLVYEARSTPLTRLVDRIEVGLRDLDSEVFAAHEREVMALIEELWELSA